MKYLLLSDTHGRLETTRDILMKHPFMDGYFHMGDVGFDPQYLEQFQIVKGNHDRHTALPLELHIQLGQRKVLCMHGNRFDEETLREVFALQELDSEDMLEECMHRLHGKLAAYARSKGCDTVFFGHTHQQCFVEYDHVALINPGSVSFGMNGAGYAIAEIQGRDIQVEMYHLENG